MKYYLAFDKGQGTREDNVDRYELINLEKLIKKDGFSKISDAINFTTMFTNYSDLFLTLYDNEVITTEFVGEPFTICYQGRNDNEWKHLGTNKYKKENKVLFKDEAYLMQKPDECELKRAYEIIEGQKFMSIDRKYVINFNITNELLGQELSIPSVWNYDTAPQEDRDHFDFLTKFNEEVRTLINAKKRTSFYGTNSNYANYINYIESFNNDLARYLSDARNHGEVNPKYFSIPIRKIVHMLCTRRNEKKERLDIDNTELLNLITIYLNFYSNRKETFRKEVELLKEGIEKLNRLNNNPQIIMPIDNTPQNPVVVDNNSQISEPVNNQPANDGAQLDLWGHEVPVIRKRRKK